MELIFISNPVLSIFKGMKFLALASTWALAGAVPSWLPSMGDGKNSACFNQYQGGGTVLAQVTKSMPQLLCFLHAQFSGLCYRLPLVAIPVHDNVLLAPIPRLLIKYPN